ncbi:hypothetical protein C8J56DRAFT_927312 [Mycena floridula]|nr:hypothetical protein C8J56DRAFT_927312 [Mycena floridula]
MQDPLRSGNSIAQPPRTSRLSKFLKTKIRLSTPKDLDSNSSPYMISRSAQKPFMSQPVLSMPNPYPYTHSSDDDSPQSASPNRSPTFPEEIPAPVLSSKKIPRHSISTAILPTTNLGLVVAGRQSLDGLARVSSTPLATTIAPSAPTTEPLSSRTTETRRLQKPRLSSRSRSPSRERPVKDSAATLPSRASRRPDLSGLPMPLHRFSLTLSDAAGMARLSPSIITRHPPMPILNLPTLPPSDDAPSASRRSSNPGLDRAQSQVCLRHMPTLPLSVQDEPTVEEMEEDLEDLEDLDTDEDEFMDASDLPVDVDDGDYDETGMPRASMSSEGRPQSRASSYRQPEPRPPHLSLDGEPSLAPTMISPPPHQAQSVLPLIDTSRMDLAFLDTSPTTWFSNGNTGKGKGKARDYSDAGSTPTAKFRPQHQNDQVHQKSGHHTHQNTDYFSFSFESFHDETNAATPVDGLSTGRSRNISVTSVEHTPRPGDMFRVPSFLRGAGPDIPPVPALPPALPAPAPRPGIYKQTSRSMIDLLGGRSSLDNSLERTNSRGGLFSGRKGKEKVVKVKENGRKSIEQPSAEPSRAESRIVNLNDDEPDDAELEVPSAAAPISVSPAPRASHSRLSTIRRRRSMPSFTASEPPPPYPEFAPHYPPHTGGLSPSVQILPRDDEIEGKEKLPGYSNSVYLRAVMPRKMEFAEPGVQAKDRKWRRVLCELEGTVFRVYKCPPASVGVSAIGEWWESRVGVGDVSVVGTSTVGSTIAASRPTEQVAKLIDERALSREGSTEVQLPQPMQSTGTATTAPLSAQLQPPTATPSPEPSPNRSRFTSLLKPHSRSKSDAANVNAPKTPTPRSSFSISRPSWNSSSDLATSGSSSASLAPSFSSNASLAVSIPSSASSTSIPAGARTAPSSRSSFSRTRRTSANSQPVQPVADDSGVPLPVPEALIKRYTMQNSESGLANDYLKRQNVIRVRMEGQQFLLQATDITAVVEWIEGFQSATNISLDLDERPMPKGPMFPRRRRRRRRPETVASPSSATTNATRTSNA